MSRFLSFLKSLVALLPYIIGAIVLNDFARQPEHSIEAKLFWPAVGILYFGYLSSKHADDLKKEIVRQRNSMSEMEDKIKSLEDAVWRCESNVRDLQNDLPD